MVELGEVSWICGDSVGVVEQLLYPTFDNTWLRNLKINIKILKILKLYIYIAHV